MFIRWSILGFLANYRKDRKNEFIVPSSVRKIDENITGYDMRFPLIDETDKDIIRKVEILFAKQRLLAYLENNNISINDKVSSIAFYNKNEKGSNYGNNITSGGLFKDWDFVF